MAIVRGLWEGTYAFVHDGLQVLGFGLNNWDVGCGLHAGKGFEGTVDELLRLVFVFCHVERGPYLLALGWSRT